MYSLGYCIPQTDRLIVVTPEMQRETANIIKASKKGPISAQLTKLTANNCFVCKYFRHTYL